MNGQPVRFASPGGASVSGPNGAHLYPMRGNAPPLNMRGGPMPMRGANMPMPPGAHLVKGPPLPYNPAVGVSVNSSSAGRGAAASMSAGGPPLSFNSSSSPSASTAPPNAKIMMSRGRGDPVPVNMRGRGASGPGPGPGPVGPMNGGRGGQPMMMPARGGMAGMVSASQSRSNSAGPIPPMQHPTMTMKMSPAQMANFQQQGWSKGMVPAPQGNGPRSSSANGQSPRPIPVPGGSGPYQPVFTVVNGKKIMVPPNTALPAPAAMMAMGAKKIMAGPGQPPHSPGGGGSPSMKLQLHPPNTAQLRQDVSPPTMYRVPGGVTPPRGNVHPSPVRRPGEGPTNAGAHPLIPAPQQQHARPGAGAAAVTPWPSPTMPPAALHSEDEEGQKTKKNLSLKHGLSEAWNKLKFGSDSDEDKPSPSTRPAPAPVAAAARPNERPEMSYPGGPIHPNTISTNSQSASLHPQAVPPAMNAFKKQPHQPVSPSTAFVMVNGKKMMTALPPGAHVVGAPRPGMQKMPAVPMQQQQRYSSAGPPATPLRTGVRGIEPPVDRSPVRSSSATYATPPNVVPPQKMIMKGPPGAPMFMKKKMMAAIATPGPSPAPVPPAGGMASSGEPRPPLATVTHSRTASVASQPQLTASIGTYAIPPGPPLVKRVVPFEGITSLPPHPQGAQSSTATSITTQQPAPFEFHSPARGAARTSSPSPESVLSSSVVRVPGTTVLRGEELPEAGVQQPPKPRRRFGESSEDSDDDNAGNGNRGTVKDDSPKASAVNEVSAHPSPPPRSQQQHRTDFIDAAERLKEAEGRTTNRTPSDTARALVDVIVEEDKDTDERYNHHHSDDDDDHAQHTQEQVEANASSSAGAAKLATSQRGRTRVHETKDPIVLSASATQHEETHHAAATAPSSARSRSVPRGEKPSATVGLPAIRQTARSAAAAAKSAARRKKEEEARRLAVEETTSATNKKRPARSHSPKPSTSAKSRKTDPVSPMDAEATQRPGKSPTTAASSLSSSVVSSSRSSSARSPSATRVAQSNHVEATPTDARTDDFIADAAAAPVKQQDKKAKSSTTRTSNGRHKPRKKADSFNPKEEAAAKERGEKKRRGHSSDKRHHSSRRARGEADTSDGEDADVNHSSSNTSSEPPQLTTRELYQLATALRDNKLNAKQTRRYSLVERLKHEYGEDIAAAVVGQAMAHDHGGHRSEESSTHSRTRPSPRPHSKTRRDARRSPTSTSSHSAVPGATSGIPWRYGGGGGRTFEPFGSPPALRRPLGYIDVGGGVFAQVNSTGNGSVGATTNSPYARRHPSSPSLSTVHRNAPFAAESTAVPRRWESGTGAAQRVRDMDTSALIDARENAVVAEEAGAGYFAGAQGSSRAYYQHHQHTPTKSQGRRGIRTMEALSPIRPASAPGQSPLHQRSVKAATGEEETGESSSVADSQHPYCVSTLATVSAVRAMTPLRRAAPRQRSRSPTQNQQQRGPVRPMRPERDDAPPLALESSSKPQDGDRVSQRQHGRSSSAQRVSGGDGRSHSHARSASAGASSATSATTRAITAAGKRPALDALLRSAFFEQLHSGVSSPPRAEPKKLSPFQGGQAHASAAETLLPSYNQLHQDGRRSDGGASGWLWGKRLDEVVSDHRGASVHSGGVDSKGKRSAVSHGSGRQTGKSTLTSVHGSGTPQLIPGAGTSKKAGGGSESAWHRPTSRRTPRPASAARERAVTENHPIVSNSYVEHVHLSTANGPHGSSPYVLPTRRKTPVRLTEATIARLSSPQHRHNGTANAISPITRRSAGGGGGGGGGRDLSHNRSATSQNCSRWLDDILGSTTVTATGVRAGGKGEDAAALAKDALPVVDLRKDFKPRTINDSGISGTVAVVSAAKSLLDDAVSDGYGQAFNGTKARPHVRGVSFRHMTGVRTQSVHSADRAKSATRSIGGGANTSPVPLRVVHGMSDGLPYAQYSTMVDRQPHRKSPWALAPEREGLDVLPGQAVLARRRRFSLNTAGGGAAANEGSDSVEDAHMATRKEEMVVKEEVHLDEYRRPYLVVRPVPTAEAAEAQRLTVQRLSRPKPVYQRAVEEPV